MTNLCNLIVSLVSKPNTTSQVCSELQRRKLTFIVHMDICCLVVLYREMTINLIFDMYPVLLGARSIYNTRNAYVNRDYNINYFRINDRKCIQSAGQLSYLYTFEHYVVDPLSYPDENISRLSLFHHAKCENLT